MAFDANTLLEALFLRVCLSGKNLLVWTLLVSFPGQAGLLARFREVLGTSQLVRLEKLARLCDPFKPAKIFY